VAAAVGLAAAVHAGPVQQAAGDAVPRAPGALPDKDEVADDREPRGRQRGRGGVASRPAGATGARGEFNCLSRYSDAKADD